MLVYEDEISFNEVHDYFDIRDNRIVVHTALTNGFDDSWYDDYIISEEDTKRLMLLLGTTTEEDTVKAIMDRYQPDEGQSKDDMSLFVGAFISFCMKNNIRIRDESTIWYDDIEQKTKKVLYI